MRRVATIAVAALLLASCGGERQLPAVTDIEVVETEWPASSEWGAETATSDAQDAGWPSGVTVWLTVDNPAGSLVLREGRLRLTCGGGRAAVLVLRERVRIPDRGLCKVMVPLRVRVARNGSALSLRSAIVRRDAAAIGVDWEMSVRRGLWRGRVEEEMTSLDKLLPVEELERLWQVLDRVSGATVGSGAAASEESVIGTESGTADETRENGENE